MPNTHFQFKEFIVHQDKCAMKVTTDACLFGAWIVHDLITESNSVISVLDIGTGTGLLSLMIAQKNPKASFDAIEIYKETAQQAFENVCISPWKKQIGIANADARNYSYEKKYGLIISNPPFYENEIRSSNERKNLAHHGDDLTLKELLTIIKKNLLEDGCFFLLLPYKRHQEIRKVFKNHGLYFIKICFIRPSTNHDYFRIMLKGKPSKEPENETAIEELSIWDGQQQYTDEFKSLLKDYYLYL